MLKKIKKIVKQASILMLVVLIVFVQQGFIFSLIKPIVEPATVEAGSLVLSTKADFNSGFYYQTDSKIQNGSLQMAADMSWNARVWKTPNVVLSDGTAFATDGTYNYMIRNLDNEFMRYRPAEDRWEKLANAPYAPYSGADMVYLDGYIYAGFGGYQNKFARYNISTNTWSVRAEYPALIYSGHSLETDGTDIFALRGANTNDFWKYEVANNRWVIMSSPSLSMYYGADLIYVNYLGTNYLYTPRGNSTTFYRYNIDNPGWETRAVTLTSITDNGAMVKRGDYIYMLRGSSHTNFYRYSIVNNSWESLTSAPVATRYVGLTYNAYEDLIYVFQGNGSYNWWKFDPDTGATGTFLGEIDLPAAPGTGSDLVYKNGILHYRRGANTNNYYTYSLSDDTWTSRTGPDDITFNDDNKGVLAGNYIYYFRGSGNSDFVRYDTVGNAFETRTSTLATVTYGASLAYPGSGDYIYATRGGTNLTFWRYSISDNSWLAMANLSADSEPGYGSRLVSDGTYVYAITGLGTGRLLRYTPDSGTGSWESLGQAPFAPYYGTDMVFYNGRIYAIAGYYKTSVWEYTINGTQGSWRKLQDLPGYYAYDYGPYNGGSIASDGAGTFYITNGAGLTRLISFTVTANNYPSSGYWISDIVDLEYVDSWGELETESTVPDGATVLIQGQSSSDLITWTSYYNITAGVFDENIAANRYLRLKVVFTPGSSQTTTPILKEIVVNYTGDDNSPTNPTSVSLTAKSQTVGGITLTSSQSYNYTNPYFSWSDPGSDSETEVEGYYLYFGISAVEDDEDNFSYQTETDYVATTPMSTGTYYLRIKTKDSTGNIADATTLFSYVYNGVSPPNSEAVTTTTQFDTGTADKVNTASDQLKLESKAGFWQQERLTRIPGSINYGAGFAYVESTNKLYTFRGNSTSFYEYDIDTDTWATKDNALATVYRGGEVVEGPEGYLYGFRGENTNKFWVYDINQNDWNDENALDALGNIYYGSSAVYDDDQYIYLMRGGNDNDFYRYDATVEGGTWEGLAATDFDGGSTTQNNNVYVGGDMAYNGDGTIYAIQGYYRPGFSSYDTSSDSWTPLSSLPSLPYNGAQIEYDSTTNAIYFLKGANDPDFFKYDITTQEWSSLPDAPETVTSGASMRAVNGMLYVLRGGNSFYKFDIAKNSWLTPTTNIFGQEYRGADPVDFYYGTEIVKGNNNWYYFTRGNYDSRFARYNSTTGQAEQLSDAPTGFYIGSSMAYNEDEGTDGTIYAVGSQYDPNLYKYDINTDTWTQITSDPLEYDSGYGSSLAYDGSRYLYWTRGAGQSHFYRYDTDATAGSRWEQLTDTLAIIGYGSQLVAKGNYLYALQGNNTANNPFYRYTPSPTNSWELLTPLTIDVYNDGFLVDGGTDYLYACKAENTALCYRYSLSGNSWEAVANAPPNIYMGGAAASNNLDKMYVVAGSSRYSPGDHYYGNNFVSGVYSYIFQTETSSFESEGTYTSASHDLEGVYRFANLELDYQSATNSAITAYTQTSADNENWSSWTQTTEGKLIDGAYSYKINSSAQRYLKVKIEFTSSDNIYSAVINNYTIDYYVDDDSPENPADDGFSAYTTATVAASLITNTWANSSNPYFTWVAAEATNGASDGAGGSGVDGYYVYFGTDNEVNASESGTLVTDPEYTASNLTSDETYYLRIQTIDEAGNFSDTNWQPFIYKFDNTSPENPSTVVVTPSGYTNVNDYTVTWNGATDSASLIKQYWYKSGPTGSESATLEATASGVLKYQTGTNTFYLQAQDYAGNRASSWVTASYYYSGTAAGAPQSLRVTYPTGSSSNTVNEFAFAWDPPSFYYGQQTALRYHYWINRLPSVGTSENSTGLAVAYLSKGAYAQDPGENTLYVVAEDEAGNIDYNNYSSVSFTSSTSAPGQPRNIDISDVSIKETSAWRLALSWDTPSASGSGIAEYRIYRSATTDAECPADPTSSSDFTYIASTTQTSYVDTGLTQTTKYYCVTACNYTGGKGCGVASDTVSLYPDGRWRVSPDLTASPSATVKTKAATIEWSTARTANSFVQYGTASGDYGEETGSSEQVTSHSVDLSGLEPGTTYYFKCIWTDEDGNTGESDEITFTTNPAPYVSSVKFSSVNINSAFVIFTIKNANKATIEYGKTLTYGSSQSMSTSTSETTYTVQLSDLIEGTDYHLRIAAEDEEANIYYSDDYTFETLPTPKIVNLKIQQVVGMPTSTLRLIWRSNTLISSIVTYYPTQHPEKAADQISLALKTNHDVILKDLLDNTDYTLIIKGKDSSGNDASSETKQVKTANDVRPPEVLNMNVESSINGVGDAATAQIVISWDTDEPATTQVEYAQGTGTSYGQSTQEDTSLTANHTVSITNLTPAKIYHLRALSKDKAANIGLSFDTVIITPKSTKDALSLVIENLSKTFGFLNNLSISK